jgi:hypothetical protein
MMSGRQLANGEAREDYARSTYRISSRRERIQIEYYDLSTDSECIIGQLD